MSNETGANSSTANKGKSSYLPSWTKHIAFQISIGAIAGVIFGILVGEWAKNLEFIGTIFIRLIQMSIVPLVMASVIQATGSMCGKGTGIMALRTFKWMLGFSAVSAVLAWALSELIKPGEGIGTIAKTVDTSIQGKIADASGWQDTIVDFVTTNIFNAMSTSSMIPIIVFSLLFGIALNGYVTRTGNRLLVDVFEQTQQVVLSIIQMVMYLAPIGVFALLANLTGTVGFSVVISGLKYLMTTLIGVIILMLFFLLVVWLRTGLNPIKLCIKLIEQTIIAITTTSSAVTFPCVLKTCVEKVGVSQRVSNFTLSVGLTMGSYGAVLNYMIVVMFLAQVAGIELSIGQLLLGMGLSIMLNMGTITVPGGFPVVAMFLATSLGLPIEFVGVLIAVDWFTGIFRTFLNVNGDTIVAILVANASGDIDKDIYNDIKTVKCETLNLDEVQKEIDRCGMSD